MFRSKNKSIEDLLKETKNAGNKDHISKVIIALDQKKIAPQIIKSSEDFMRIEKLKAIFILIQNFQEAKLANKDLIARTLSSIQDKIFRLSKEYPNDPLINNAVIYVRSSINHHAKKNSIKVDTKAKSEEIPRVNPENKVSVQSNEPNNLDKIISTLENGKDKFNTPELKKLYTNLMMLISHVKNFKEAKVNDRTLTMKLSSIKKLIDKINNNYSQVSWITNITEYVSDDLNQFVEANYPGVNKYSVPTIGIMSHQIELGQVLGSGKGGTVHKSEIKDKAVISQLVNLGLCDKPENENAPVFVAVKIAKEGQSADLEADRFFGAILWNKRQEYIKDKGHPPLCNVSLGGTVDGVDVIFSHLESGGEFQGNLARFNTQEKKAEFLKNVIHDLFENMNFMHSANVLHLDTADRNILITKDDRAVRIDNGLSLHENVTGLNKIPENQERPFKWMDSLLILTNVASKYSDLYSLKITIMQLIMQTAGKGPHDIFNDAPDDVFGFISKLRDIGDMGMLNTLISTMDKYFHNSKDPNCQVAAYVLDCYREFLSVGLTAEQTGEIAWMVRSETVDEKTIHEKLNTLVVDQMEKAIAGLKHGEERFNAGLGAAFSKPIETTLNSDQATVNRNASSLSRSYQKISVPPSDDFHSQPSTVRKEGLFARRNNPTKEINPPDVKPERNGPSKN